MDKILDIIHRGGNNKKKNEKTIQIVPLNLSKVNTDDFNHRSGWKYAMQGLEVLRNDEKGILLEDFLERTFGWHYCANINTQEKILCLNDELDVVKLKDLKIYKSTHAAMFKKKFQFFGMIYHKNGKNLLLNWKIFQFKTSLQ